MRKDKLLIISESSLRSAQEIKKDALNLYYMWKEGLLGGEHMPEDVHPLLPTDSSELLHYLTLGMSLNYQRNSYTLWEACTHAFDNKHDKWIFNPIIVSQTDREKLRDTLVKCKVALQPNKHPENWARVSDGIVKFGDGDMRNILESNNYDISCIRRFIQENKKSFPYLAGNKICNYWLYVLSQYTSFPLINRESLTIAPDTHVINASIKLGVISLSEKGDIHLQEKCSNAWSDILSGSSFSPIDIHTPLWLWSRLKFPEITERPS